MSEGVVSLGNHMHWFILMNDVMKGWIRHLVQIIAADDVDWSWRAHDEGGGGPVYRGGGAAIATGAAAAVLQCRVDAS